MSESYMEVVEMEDEEIDSYLQVAFGVANVSPADRKKLMPLVKFYAKKPHPFRACVKDNRKRFGPLTEKYCAVVKDLIKGSTRWRSTERKKGLSESTLKELFGLSIDEGFVAFLSELTDEEVREMMEDTTTDQAEFTDGEAEWKSDEGLNTLRRKVDNALNSTTDVGLSYWVEDITKNKALVNGGKGYYYIVPFSVKKGEVVLSDEDNWTSASKEWVESNVALSEEPDLMAEMFFGDSDKTEADEEGLVWKPILREGIWKFSPGSGQQPVSKPITVKKDGKSDRHNLVISMSELKKNFEAGIVEHVTIPTSHSDTVLENTGFVKKLRFTKDAEGRHVLEAGHHFTEPDVKVKAERGTIANTSAGILFDYLHKETGKKFGSVLAHVALTNRPWLNGMKPFGVKASEDLQVVGFSDVESIDPAQAGGGERMSESTFDLSTLGLSEDELKARLSRLDALEAKDREREVADRCKTWQEEGKAPALVSEARAIMMSDKGGTVLHLSENGKEEELTATDIVERLIAATPAVNLSQDPVTDGAASTDRPDDSGEESNLSQEERVLASQLFFDEGLTEEEAVAEAKKRLAVGASN